MTVRGNVAFGLEIRKRPKHEIKDRVDELLELVHLSQFADRYPSQLSGGQRQRMALARALAVEPQVLLLDEPFGALDAKVRKELRDWLRRLHDEVHVTTVFVTHDQEEAMEVADEIVVINNGAVEQIGTPDQLYDEPVNDFVMNFLGPVTQLGGVAVRPHDIEILTLRRAAAQCRQPSCGWCGSASRSASTPIADGQDVWVQISRGEADRLDLRAGQRSLPATCSGPSRARCRGRLNQGSAVRPTRTLPRMPVPFEPSADLGLTWQAITLDDIDIWHELVGAIEDCDKPSGRLDRDDLIEELTNGSYKDPARNTLIGIDADGTARAFGNMDVFPGETLRRIFLGGGVHPEWRRRGIGREVLRWQTARAREALTEQETADSGAALIPWRIIATHEECLTDRNALFDAAGLCSDPLVPRHGAPAGWRRGTDPRDHGARGSAPCAMDRGPGRIGSARPQRIICRALGLAAARRRTVEGVGHRTSHVPSRLEPGGDRPDAAGR